MQSIPTANSDLDRFRSTDPGGDRRNTERIGLNPDAMTLDEWILAKEYPEE